ncbi:chloride channel protein [Rhodobacteraceae bacterium DSL-40]|uniref:chloride channel protein n=1 Tax=Amaricoccus sp. B4 TaxID=3368557 RepID=UPI000DAB695C
MLGAHSAARILVVACAGVVIGAVASVAAVGFVDAVGWLNTLFLVSLDARTDTTVQPYVLTALTILGPAGGGLATGLIVRHVIREQRALGPADAILAVQGRNPMPSLQSGLGATLAALIALGTGASIGQYGPLVVMGATIGDIARRLERHFRDLRSISIACGVAAAIATAFHAPIAGLIFAHEVVLRHYALRAFAPVAVAAAMGHVMATRVFGQDPLIAVSFAGIAHDYEFVFFAIEGILAALLATLYMTLILRSGQLASRLPMPPALRPALAGLVLGLVATQVPEVLGIGRGVLQHTAEDGAFTMGALAELLVAKTAMTALCLGFGFVGGVFSPALLIGGVGGALYGLVLAALLPGATSGVAVYAICGMMAMASPVIGAPLTTILIVFEMTANYQLTIAVMASVAFANLLAHRAFGRSLFDVQLKRRGFDLSEGRDRAILHDRRVSELLTQDYLALRPSDPVGKMIELCAGRRRGEVLLIDAEGAYRGRVQLQDAIAAPATARLESLADGGGLTFGETTTLWEAMARLRAFSGEAVPLVTAEGQVAGVVPEGALIRGYMDSIHDLRREENAGA